MQKLRYFVFLICLAVAVPLLRRPVLALTAQAAPDPNAASAVHVVSPKQGEKIAQTAVTVQYEQLTPASAGGTPTFELRLDGQDAVTTTESSYTFSGLKAGVHDLVIQIVDANGTPITGTRAAVRFIVVNPPAPAAGPGSAALRPELPTGPGELPYVGTSLPLLSVLGFGILIGGVVSALRPRASQKPFIENQ
jgi:hypothetical protein